MGRQNVRCILLHGVSEITLYNQHGRQVLGLEMLQGNKVCMSFLSDTSKSGSRIFFPGDTKQILKRQHDIFKFLRGHFHIILKKF